MGRPATTRSRPDRRCGPLGGGVPHAVLGTPDSLVPCQATFASFVALGGRHAFVPANSKAGSVTAPLAEKRSGRSLRTEHVQRRVLPVLGDDGAFSLRLLTTIPPVDPDRPPLIAQPLDHGVVATVGHHGANWSSNSAHERPTGAEPPRCSEYDNCVRALQPKIERFVIVAVGDPGVAREQAALLHPPLVVRRPHPGWLPIMKVEMDQR
jgi:hypothetical protein